MSSKCKVLKIQPLAVDEVQNQQILMQKTQQFIKSVKGVTVTRVKQQISVLPVMPWNRDTVDRLVCQV